MLMSSCPLPSLFHAFSPSPTSSLHSSPLQICLSLQLHQLARCLDLFGCCVGRVSPGALSSLREVKMLPFAQLNSCKMPVCTISLRISCAFLYLTEALINVRRRKITPTHPTQPNSSNSPQITQSTPNHPKSTNSPNSPNAPKSPNSPNFTRKN